MHKCTIWDPVVCTQHLMSDFVICILGLILYSLVYHALFISSNFYSGFEQAKCISLVLKEKMPSVTTSPICKLHCVLVLALCATSRCQAWNQHRRAIDQTLGGPWHCVHQKGVRVVEKREPSTRDVKRCTELNAEARSFFTKVVDVEQEELVDGKVACERCSKT